MIRYGGNTALRDANTATIIYTVYIACTVLQPWRKMYGGVPKSGYDSEWMKGGLDSPFD